MSKFDSRKLFYAFGPRARFLIRRLYYLPADLFDQLSGRRDPLTPPRGLIYTGSGKFREIGRTAVNYCRELAGLKPNASVLDIGSGIGRIAVALTEALDPEEGRYEGFDVIETGVRWCQKNISRRFPNFHFRYIPLQNDLYRSTGESAVHFRFPYEDEQFDLVILNSVFTHMLPDEVDTYLREIRRVLKPDGRVYATFFVIDEESENLMKSVPEFSFPFRHEGYRLMDQEVQRANVAFEKDFLFQSLFGGNQLKPESYHPGFWPGRQRSDCLEFQDIVILKKAD